MAGSSNRSNRQHEKAQKSEVAKPSSTDCNQDKSKRLVLKGALAALLGDQAGQPSGLSRRITQAEAAQFAQLPLSMEADELLVQVESFLADGVAVEAIYIDLLAPAARRLGELWEQDACDFVEVTMGLWRLQQVLLEVSAKTPAGTLPLGGERKKALFLPMPGDQHFFGAQILDDVFARAGWETHLIARPLRKEALDLLSRERFDLIGLTLSRDCPSAGVRNLIKAMRSVSRNENVSILVGGRMINQNPATVAEVGADGTGADARAALDAAEALVLSAKVRSQTLR